MDSRQKHAGMTNYQNCHARMHLSGIHEKDSRQKYVGMTGSISSTTLPPHRTVFVCGK